MEAGQSTDGGEHTKRGQRVLIASGDTATLRAGQHYDPSKQAQAGTPMPEPSPDPFDSTSTTPEETAA